MLTLIHRIHLKPSPMKCPCCLENKRRVPVSRQRDFMGHLKLHITGKGHIKHHPDAASILKEMRKRRAPPAREHLQE